MGTDGTEPSTVLTRPSVAQALRRAAVRATLAPSVHNTQPWRFVLGARTLEIHADLSRRLAVLDPTGRQLMISCGCALMNARVSLAASGYLGVVERRPDPGRPSLVARLSIAPEPVPTVSRPDCGPLSLGALDAVVELRRTNRREFAPDPLPSDVLEALEKVAARESAQLVAIRTPEDRIAAAVLSQRADRQQSADPAYRAELRAWASADADREDGVPTPAIPRTDVASRDDLPIRDFDIHGTGELPAQTRSSLNQCLLLLGTVADTADAWIRAGEALQRVLLEITRFGYAASPLTQIVETPATRQELRKELRLTMQPHVLVRVGLAATTPAPRRRRLVDMLSDTP